MKRPDRPVVILVFAVVFLLFVAAPALAMGPTVQLEPDVYFIRLQPQPDASVTLTDGFRAAYERLEPTLLELVADGQIVAFEHLPEIGAVRAIAFEASLQPLASRPEVAEHRSVASPPGGPPGGPGGALS